MEEWRPFLQRWSEEWISAHDPEQNRPLAPDVVRDTWLGFAPASAEAIAGLEERLGSALPPSLRRFLEVTDGWRDAGPFIYRLCGTAEIGFMRDMDASWIDAYGEYSAATAALLHRAVQISLDGDASVLFLDPGHVDADGEWTAYRLASWSGDGPQRKGSFYDLMYDLYASFHALREPEGETRRDWDARVEESRLAALSGDIDGPLAVLAQAEHFGSTRATLLADQLRTLLQNVGGRNLIHALGEDWIHADPVFASDLLPLLFARHERSDPAASDLAFLTRIHGSDALRLMVADYQARVREPGFRIRFGNEEFDRAVHAVLGRLPAVLQSEEQRHRPGEPFVRASQADLDEAHRALDAEWPAVRDAIRLWRPASENHIAPVVLLADPRLAQMIDEDRGRELLTIPRNGHWPPPGPGQTAFMAIGTLEAPAPGDVPRLAGRAARITGAELAAAVAEAGSGGVPPGALAPDRRATAHRETLDLAVAVRCGQFYLVDRDAGLDAVVPVPADAESLGLADVVPGAAVLWTPVRAGDVPLTIVISPGDPGGDLDGYDDVVEFAYRARTGYVRVQELTGAGHELPPLPAGDGGHRCRYHVRGTGNGGASHLLQLWPQARRRPVLLKGTSRWSRARRATAFTL